MTEPFLKTRLGETIDAPLLPPVTRGQKVVVPAGTTSLYRGARRVSKRAQTITVYSAYDGYLAQSRDGSLQSVRPSISWPGSGGYWVDCEVTVAIFEANGFTPVANTANVAAWEHYLAETETLPETVRP